MFHGLETVHVIKLSEYSGNTDRGLASVDWKFRLLKKEHELTNVMDSYTEALRTGAHGIRVVTEIDQELGRNGILAWRLKSPARVDRFDLQVEVAKEENSRARKTSKVTSSCRQLWANFRRLPWATQAGVVLQVIISCVSLGTAATSYHLTRKAKTPSEARHAQLVLGAFVVSTGVLAVVKFSTDLSLLAIDVGSIKPASLV